jgi:hypothetical protein
MADTTDSDAAANPAEDVEAMQWSMLTTTVSGERLIELSEGSSSASTCDSASLRVCEDLARHASARRDRAERNRGEPRSARVVEPPAPGAVQLDCQLDCPFDCQLLDCQLDYDDVRHATTTP